MALKGFVLTCDKLGYRYWRLGEDLYPGFRHQNVTNQGVTIEGMRTDLVDCHESCIIGREANQIGQTPR